MQLIFGDATSFNQPLDNWDVSQVTNMFAMFSGATSFNQPLNNWDVNNVTDMYGMFYGAESFDQPLNNWDVSQVTNMRRMFEEASSFNQPLDNWDVSQVTNMIGMFTSATAANPDVSNWDVSSVGRMRNMFEDSNLSIENLTSIYENWSLLTLQQNVSFSAGTIKYNESGQAAGQAGRDIITDTYNWSISDGGVVVRPFIIEVDSNKSGVSNNDQFQFTGAEGNYDVVAKQNNIVVATFNDLSGEETITLPSSGVYVLEVRDKEVNGFNRIAFNFGGDEDKIKDIKQWGTIVWSSFESAFSGCSNMLVTATDVPVLSSVTNMQSMFWSATSANPNTSNWDVSSVTNMRSMFNNTLSANPDTKNWNVSSVTNMQNMFSRATSANPDVSNWDVSSVTTMFVMFDGATAANPNTSNWDVSSVTRMDLMFSDATSANPDTSNWDVSNVTNMRGMFSSASSFNQPLDNWDVSHVTDMEFMFNDALSFNQDISNWCVEQIPNEPQDFAVNSALQNNFFPNWGAECNLSTTNPEAIGFNILIYPNPSNSKVFIENDGQIILSKIKLIDMLGRDIKTLSASQITHGLDVSGIDAGNYFVQFTTVNDQQFVKRLIVK
jgi:surface protein